MNKTAINIHLYVFVWAYNLTYLGKYLRMELLCHAVTQCLTVQETAKQFSKVAIAPQSNYCQHFILCVSVLNHSSK